MCETGGGDKQTQLIEQMLAKLDKTQAQLDKSVGLQEEVNKRTKVMWDRTHSDAVTVVQKKFHNQRD